MVIIALGGNLPRSNGRTVSQTFSDTGQWLEQNGVSVLAKSGVFRSPAWPPSDQPDYLNALWQIGTDASPEDVLALLHETERRFERVRNGSVANAARTLDLDLIDYHGQVSGGQISGRQVGSREPVLPHPRMHSRAFVLLPLAEIVPNWRHPVSRRSVAELVEQLPAGHNCVRQEAEQPKNKLK